MRLTVNTNDPCYHCMSDTFKRYVDVYLNGEKQFYVVTADEEIGYVLCHEWDKSACKWVADADGNLIKRLNTGKVEIRYGTRT